MLKKNRKCIGYSGGSLTFHIQNIARKISFSRHHNRWLITYFMELSIGFSTQSIPKWLFFMCYCKRVRGQDVQFHMTHDKDQNDDCHWKMCPLLLCCHGFILCPSSRCAFLLVVCYVWVCLKIANWNPYLWWFFFLSFCRIIYWGVNQSENFWPGKHI